MRRLLYLLLILPVSAQASTYAPFRTFLTGLAKCDLIREREIITFNQMPIQILKDDMRSVDEMFSEAARGRQECYKGLRSHLAKILPPQEQDGDLQQAFVRELWNATLPMVDLHTRINRELLASMHKDISDSLILTDNFGKPEYVRESDRTQNLLKLDMLALQELNKRALAAFRLDLDMPPDLHTFIEFRMNSADRALKDALLVYEDIYEMPKLLTLARLRTRLALAHHEVAEVLAFAPTLNGLPPRLASRITSLARNLRQLSDDMDGAYSGIFSHDYNQWLQDLYEDINFANTSIHIILQHLNNHKSEIQAKQQEEEMQKAIEKLKGPQR